METTHLEKHKFLLAGAVRAARLQSGFLFFFFEVCNKMPKKAQTLSRTLKKKKKEQNLQSITKGEKKKTNVTIKKKKYKEKKKAPRALSLSHVKMKKPLCKK